MVARRRYSRRTGSGKFNVAPPSKRRWRGKAYDSRMEMRYAQWIDDDPAVLFFAEQPQIQMGTDPCIRWRLDFLVEHADKGLFLVDVKGVRTRAFEKNLKLFRQYGTLPLEIVQLRGANWLLLERVIPERYAA